MRQREREANISIRNILRYLYVHKYGVLKLKFIAKQWVKMGSMNIVTYMSDYRRGLEW
jgi:hypothetical protein